MVPSLSVSLQASPLSQKTAVRFISQRYSVVEFWQYAASEIVPKLSSADLRVGFFPFRELTHPGPREALDNTNVLACDSFVPTGS